MKHIINTAIIVVCLSLPLFAQETWNELFGFNVQSMRANRGQVELFVEVVIDDMMRWDATGDGKLSRQELSRYFRFHKGLTED